MDNKRLLVAIAVYGIRAQPTRVRVHRASSQRLVLLSLGPYDTFRYGPLNRSLWSWQSTNREQQPLDRNEQPADRQQKRLIENGEHYSEQADKRKGPNASGLA